MSHPSGEVVPSSVPTKWLWWTAIVGGGLAPLAAGIRTRHRTWLLWGSVAFGVQVLGIALNGLADDGAETATTALGSGLYVAGWSAGLVFPAALRDRYRRRVAEVESGERREAIHTGRNREREAARRLAWDDPAEALRRGVGRPDVDGADHGWVVDVNHAPAAVLQTLPSVDEDLARRIVANRDALGPVDSIEDLGIVLDLDARVVERLRATAVAVRI